MDATAFFMLHPSPVGELLLGSDGERLTYVIFQSGKKARAPEPAWREDPGPFREALRQLGAYFAGELKTFDLPLLPQGTGFQQKVWAGLREIPYGETRSYGELARALGRPAASRAVGAANGRNPLPIVVPCHRVIGSDGSLTGFGGGLPVKRALLDLERGHAPPPGGQLALL